MFFIFAMALLTQAVMFSLAATVLVARLVADEEGSAFVAWLALIGLLLTLWWVCQ